MIVRAAASTFQSAASNIDYAFNWFYVNSKDTSYYDSGRNPVRASGVDPNLQEAHDALDAAVDSAFGLKWDHGSTNLVRQQMLFKLYVNRTAGLLCCAVPAAPPLPW